MHFFFFLKLKKNNVPHTKSMLCPCGQPAVLNFYYPTKCIPCYVRDSVFHTMPFACLVCAETHDELANACEFRPFRWFAQEVCYDCGREKLQQELTVFMPISDLVQITMAHAQKKIKRIYSP